MNAEFDSDDEPVKAIRMVVSLIEHAIKFEAGFGINTVGVIVEVSSHEEKNIAVAITQREAIDARIRFI